MHIGAAMIAFDIKLKPLRVNMYICTVKPDPDIYTSYFLKKKKKRTPKLRPKSNGFIKKLFKIILKLDFLFWSKLHSR